MPEEALRDAVRASLLEMLEGAQDPDAVLIRLEQEAERLAGAIMPNVSAVDVIAVLASVIMEIREARAARKPH